MDYRLSIAGRCFSMLIVPTILLVALGGWLMVERWRSADTLSKIGAMAESAPVISGLIHEMQKERGYSAGFIGSGGKRFAEHLSSQRRATDEASKVFNQDLVNVDLTSHGGTFQSLLGEVVGALAALDEKRSEVSGLSLSVGEMATYYTGTINRLLRLVEQVGAQSNADRLSRMTIAYEAVLLAKERAGLERAMGANGFGKGKFEPEILRRFVDLIGQQRAFMKTFQSTAIPEHRDFFDKTMNGLVVEEVQRLRDIAIQSPFSNDLEGVSGPAWFATITKKIDLYKVIEDRIATDLLTLAAAREVNAFREFLIITVVLSLAIAVTITLGWYMANDIVRALKGTVSTIGSLTRGEQIEIEGVERADEIGSVCRSLEAVYQKGLEAERLKSALDSCRTMVLVANRHFNIVYVNPVLEQLFRRFESDLRKSLPSFDHNQLIGNALNIFGDELGGLQGVIERDQRPRQFDLCFGARRLRIVANPVINDSGNFLGVVVEWDDVTTDLSMQEEINRVITASGQGDFSQRIDLNGVDGVYRNLANGMNQLSTVVDRATEDLTAIMGMIAKGDLTQRLTADYQGRFGELKNSVNDMAEQFASIVMEVQNATSEVKNAAAEINAGTDDLSHRTEQAASNLEETAAASEEMAATVKQNANNAKNADELAGSANEVASRGGATVEQAVSAMGQIDDSARKITDIISVIDEIAFQTNLLALNASVEAARAGEAGKGFAVVAQEVRQLAQRSAKAASDIKSLIHNSNAQVKDGVRLVNQTGEALSEILSSIGQVTSIVREISSASQEQAAGVQEINGSITAMDEMTQQNSALVEESAASARALADQSQKLTDLMDFFKTGEDKPKPEVIARSSRLATSAVQRPRPEANAAASASDHGWQDF